MAEMSNAMSNVQCRYCHEKGFYKPFQHERICSENPENLPNITVTHVCGHQGEHKPFDSTSEGILKRRAFEAERPCQNCWLDKYREAQANRTPEQIAEQQAEALAAHGPGVDLVNVITGETFKT